MSTLRYDVATNDWVIFAPERVRRPYDHVVENTVAASPEFAAGPCPFCPGNEQLAGPEIFALRHGTAPNMPGWSVRVIPNKFPALRIEDNPHRIDEGQFLHAMGGCGAHEVIIESPDHNMVLERKPVDQIEFLLRTLQLRFQDLLGDRRFEAIILLKNHGEQAGTSLRHPHWQLIATPVVPRALRLKHAVATDYYDQTGTCLYCMLLNEELALRDRVVAENAQFAAIEPYASRVPFETWILPKNHNSSFAREEAAHLRPLAEILKTTLLKLSAALQELHYNITVNTAPRGDEDKNYFLWHIEIVPRLAYTAGFELGSGMAINTVMPEEAAKYLRETHAD
jgi:UDPglucose--hexose-1-phosphate uridylyltransferase